MPPPPPSGPDALEALLARTAPAVLGLLGDGVPRSRAEIVAALAGRHGKGDVTLALMRLLVTDRVAKVGGKHTLGAEAG